MWRVVFKEGGGRKGGASSYLRKRSGWRVISFRKGGWCSYQFLALIAFPSTKTPLKLPNHFPPHHLPPLFRTPILSAHLQKMRKGWKMVSRLTDN